MIDFLDYLNNVVPSIKITHEISTASVYFLDTTVLKDEQGYINTDVYQKPTDTHPYLHWTSAHPPHLKRSIPYSQALRLTRICSSTDTLRKRIIEYSDFFVACRYERGKVLNDSRGVFTDQRTAYQWTESLLLLHTIPKQHLLRKLQNVIGTFFNKRTISTNIQQTTTGCI